ncbi:peptidoglycan-recognition protein 2 [Thrips palmi]|uniref:Peptidoglycan-recognition protein 2 n=1 Tax=Thrips palmi TaxID=161013 RepID=A0A6P8YKC9_THRPL|nr:peptidoglycan-recognition protein 2 [Thrips palmi]
MRPGASASLRSLRSPLRAATILGPVLLSMSLTPQGDAACPNIISRQLWGASPSAAVHYITTPVPDVIVGHTAGPRCGSETACAREVHSIQQQHKDLGFGDIGYGFLIGGDAGYVFQGRGWHQRGAHTYGYNNKSIGVAFLGDYSDAGASTRQMNALRDLLQCGVQLGELPDDVRVYGQRQVQRTESPGLALYQQLQELPQWVEVP